MDAALAIKIADPEHCHDECPHIDPGLCTKYRVGPCKDPHYLQFDIKRFGVSNCWFRCIECREEFPDG
jgi:hypothetical protein